MAEQDGHWTDKLSLDELKQMLGNGSRDTELGRAVTARESALKAADAAKSRFGSGGGLGSRLNRAGSEVIDSVPDTKQEGRDIRTPDRPINPGGAIGSRLSRVGK